MDKKSLPNGFKTVEEAVKLINSNTFNEPTVDIKWLAGHLDWVEEAHNFRIPQVRLITKEEYTQYMDEHHGRRPSELVQKGSVFVMINTSYDKELIKKSIRDNYKKVAGHEFEAPITRGISTVKDEGGADNVRPRVTKKTIAKEGDIIGASTTVGTTNTADGAGL